MGKIVIGKEEWAALPELGLPAIKMRVDSGAKTSSLHAFNIQLIDEADGQYATFDIHPVQNNRKLIQRCRAIVIDKRDIKSSTGDTERRLVIKTPITVGEETWDIEVTLANRDTMGYRMLLGREAMNKRVLIDPDASFCLGERDDTNVKSFYQPIQRNKNGLKIALLASNPDLYSNKRIIEAGEERGHEMDFIDIKQCFMNISPEMPEAHYRGGSEQLDYDAIIPRIKPAMTFYGCAVVRQFDALGAYCLNNSSSITRSRDKLQSLQLLSGHRIPMPITGFAHSPADTKAIIKMVGGAPLVVKLLEGTQGKGVVLAETNKAAESVINAFKSLQANILVQEFIKEADGKDIRCFVIDGKVVGSIQRSAAAGEFRANLHLGGTASAVKITPTERKVAINATKAMGLKVAGVDIIRSKDGPKVLEINSSPGLEGIENVTGKNIASMMIECIERNVRRNRKMLSA